MENACQTRCTQTTKVCCRFDLNFKISLRRDWFNNCLCVSVPRYRCNSNGEWTVPTGMCQCRAGYTANNGASECQGVWCCENVETTYWHCWSSHCLNSNPGVWWRIYLAFITRTPFMMLVARTQPWNLLVPSAQITTGFDKKHASCCKCDLMSSCATKTAQPISTRLRLLKWTPYLFSGRPYVLVWQGLMWCQKPFKTVSLKVRSFQICLFQCNLKFTFLKLNEQIFD